MNIVIFKQQVNYTPKFQLVKETFMNVLGTAENIILYSKRVMFHCLLDLFASLLFEFADVLLNLEC